MNYDRYVALLGIAELPTGTHLASEYGNVYEVTHVWPSIGGTTHPKFTLKHLQSEEEFVWTYNDIRYHRLKTIEPEEVPLALLGGA